MITVQNGRRPAPSAAQTRKPPLTQEAHRYEDQKQDPAHSADGPFVHWDRAHVHLVWDKQEPDEYISEKYV